MIEIKRKGSRSIKEIPATILEQLNRGEIESANLVEFLGVDRKILLENLLMQCGRKKYLEPILKRLDKLEKQTPKTVYETIAMGIYEQIRAHHDSDLLFTISRHRSDIVRCWATYIIGKNTELSVQQML